jgi:hypothetical protein
VNTLKGPKGTAYFEVWADGQPINGQDVQCGKRAVYIDPTLTQTAGYTDPPAAEEVVEPKPPTPKDK